MARFTDVGFEEEPPVTDPKVLGERLAQEVEKAVCDVEYVQQLLDLGAPVDFESKTRNFPLTPLMQAVRLDNAGLLYLLLDNGADIDRISGWNCMTALMIAADEGRTDILKVLLSRGAKPDVQDRIGWHCLTTAAYRGHAEIVETLILHGMDPEKPDGMGQTARGIAEKWKRVAVVETLDALQMKKIADGIRGGLKHDMEPITPLTVRRKGMRP